MIKKSYVFFVSSLFLLIQATTSIIVDKSVELIQYENRVVQTALASN